MDGAESTRVLEQQRLDVRAQLADLMQSSAEALTGTSTGGLGQFRGCESSGLETYKNFRYRASGRIDVDPVTERPYLDALEPVLQDGGFEAVVTGDRPGGRTLSATREGLEASISELPDQGGYVLLTVAGPCVDVPTDQSDQWLRRSDEDPIP